MACDQCEAVSINGIACHETGCPNSWRHPVTMAGYLKPCFECGFDFTPEQQFESVCVDCREDS